MSDQSKQFEILESQDAMKKHIDLSNKGSILFEAIVGSQAYGTNLPTSDIDKKFIYIEPLENYLSGNITKQINVTKDYVGYEITRYMELVRTNNPNILELINSPDDCIIICNAIFKKHIIDKAHLFLSKQTRFSFGEYAAMQIKKARGLNKKIVNPMEKERKGLIDFCWVGHNQGTISLKEWLVKHNYKEENCGVVAIDHMKNCFHLFYDERYKETYKGVVDKDNVQIKLSSVEKGFQPKVLFYCNIEGFSKYCKDYKEYWDWVNERNPERYETNMSIGASFDTKNMMHCHRLLDMAIEILRDGKVNVRRLNREQLLKIRAGEYSYEELILDAETKIKLMDELYKTTLLPEKLEHSLIYNTILELRKDFYNLH